MNGGEKFSDFIMINYSALAIVISPNPCSQFFNIDGFSGEYNVTIFDVEGKQVFSEFNLNDTQKIDISQLHSGIYFVFISSYNNNVVKELVVK